MFLPKREYCVWRLYPSCDEYRNAIKQQFFLTQSKTKNQEICMICFIQGDMFHSSEMHHMFLEVFSLGFIISKKHIFLLSGHELIFRTTSRYSLSLQCIGKFEWFFVFNFDFLNQPTRFFLVQNQKEVTALKNFYHGLKNLRA